MARTVNFTDAEIMKARLLREQATTAKDLRTALSALLVAEAGLDTVTTLAILGISERTVFRHRGRIRNQEEEKRNTWGGRRHSVMTIEEEQAFLRTWEHKAREGGVLSVPPIHAALVERLGRSLPLSTTYRLLARHGWRKVQPDTKHPKGKPEIQEEFKKTPRDGVVCLFKECGECTCAVDVSG